MNFTQKISLLFATIFGSLLFMCPLQGMLTGIEAERHFGEIVPIKDIPEYLKNRATEVTRGYKAANLCLLYKNIYRDHLLQERLTAHGGYSVVVPDFISLTSNECQDIFGLHLETVTAIHGIENVIRHGMSIQEQIEVKRREVEQTSEERCVTPRESDLCRFLHEAQVNGWSLMVRSSGMKEDTDSNALANHM